MHSGDGKMIFSCVFGVTGVLCVFLPSLFLGMIYVLCTIKRMFGYHSSTCIYYDFFVLIRCSRFIFGLFSSLPIC